MDTRLRGLPIYLSVLLPFVPFLVSYRSTLTMCSTTVRVPSIHVSSRVPESMNSGRHDYRAAQNKPLYCTMYDSIYDLWTCGTLVGCDEREMKNESEKRDGIAMRNFPRYCGPTRFKVFRNHNDPQLCSSVILSIGEYHLHDGLSGRKDSTRLWNRLSGPREKTMNEKTWHSAKIFIMIGTTHIYSVCVHVYFQWILILYF